MCAGTALSAVIPKSDTPSGLVQDPAGSTNNIDNVIDNHSNSSSSNSSSSNSIENAGNSIGTLLQIPVALAVTFKGDCENLLVHNVIGMTYHEIQETIQEAVEQFSLNSHTSISTSISNNSTIASTNNNSSHTETEYVVVYQNHILDNTTTADLGAGLNYFQQMALTYFAKSEGILEAALSAAVAAAREVGISDNVPEKPGYLQFYARGKQPQLHYIQSFQGPGGSRPPNAHQGRPGRLVMPDNPIHPSNGGGSDFDDNNNINGNGNGWADSESPNMPNYREHGPGGPLSPMGGRYGGYVKQGPYGSGGVVRKRNDDDDNEDDNDDDNEGHEEDNEENKDSSVSSQFSQHSQHADSSGVPTGENHMGSHHHHESGSLHVPSFASIPSSTGDLHMPSIPSMPTDLHIPSMPTDRHIPSAPFMPSDLRIPSASSIPQSVPPLSSLIPGAASGHGSGLPNPKINLPSGGADIGGESGKGRPNGHSHLPLGDVPEKLNGMAHNHGIGINNNNGGSGGGGSHEVNDGKIKVTGIDKHMSNPLATNDK